MISPYLTHSVPMGHESMTAERFWQATPTLGQQRLPVFHKSMLSVQGDEHRLMLALLSYQQAI